MKLTSITDHQTQEQIDATNAINDQYELECHIAEMQRWQYHKLQRMLATIEQMMHTHIKNTLNHEL